MKSGLTLIEMIAALAVVSMLAAASLAVVGNLSRLETMSQKRHDELMLRSSLEDALAADIAQATQYRAVPDGFFIRTSASLDPKTMAPQHLRAIVGYSVRKIGSRRWLVRTQRPMVEGEETAELVCSSVEAVSLRDAESSDSPSEDWQSMPAAVAVEVRFAGGDGAPAAYTFHLE